MIQSFGSTRTNDILNTGLCEDQNYSSSSEVEHHKMFEVLLTFNVDCPDGNKRLYVLAPT